MKRLSLITHLPFWHPGSGDRTRVLELVRHFSKKYSMSVIVLRRLGAWREEDQRQSPLFIKCFQEINVNLTILPVTANTGPALQKILMDLDTQAIIFVHLHLVKFVSSVPSNVLTIIDTIDLVSKSVETIRNAGRSPDTSLSFSQELRYLEKFDVLIAIKDMDHTLLVEQFGPDRVLLAPPASNLPRQTVREKVEVIGFVSSNSEPNRWAIHDFISDVWPSIMSPGLELHIFGSIVDKLENYLNQNIVLHDFVEHKRQIYQGIDIVINPVVAGAGIKVKNIEALMSGLPLVTSEHSAQGLGGIAGEAYLVAKNQTEFQSQLGVLISSYERRSTVADAGFAVAQKNFTPDACFAPLHQFLVDR